MRRRTDDTGSLTLALLLTLVGVTLSALLVPLVLGQIGAAREESRRTQEIGAAETGLDVALAHLRAAVDGSGNGVRASLPCGPLTGSVGTAGPARYQVTIDYLAVDPIGRSDPWVTANRIRCTAGAGPASAPAFALLRAQGTGQATGAFGTVPARSVRATYPLRIAGVNNTGGLIRGYGTELCLDAGSGTPVAGTNVQAQPCAEGDQRQRVAYTANLSLVLVASRTTAAPLGMCLDAGTPHGVGRALQVQPCATTTRPQQQWIAGPGGAFLGTADGFAPDGFCFAVQSPNQPGSFVTLATGCGGAFGGARSFAPDPGVGTGAAGPAAGQLVNAGQFSRCLDVTGQDVTSPYLVAPVCQQATTPAKVTWDQRWTTPATGTTGRISTTAPAGTYCLRSPASPAPGRYVRVVRCPAGATPANLRWTMYADHRIVDASGYCLAPTGAADLYSVAQQISKIVVAGCDGSAAQRWNAPPDADRAMRDIGEK